MSKLKIGDIVTIENYSSCAFIPEGSIEPIPTGVICAYYKHTDEWIVMGVDGEFPTTQHDSYTVHKIKPNNTMLVLKSKPGNIMFIASSNLKKSAVNNQEFSITIEVASNKCRQIEAKKMLLATNNHYTAEDNQKSILHNICSYVFDLSESIR